MIYISKSEALSAGLTHEGTLYGVPAWFADDGSGEIAAATPKLVPLRFWCWLADHAYELATYFMRSDQMLESPIKVTKRITP